MNTLYVVERQKIGTEEWVPHCMLAFEDDDEAQSIANQKTEESLHNGLKLNYRVSKYGPVKRGD